MILAIGEKKKKVDIFCTRPFYPCLFNVIMISIKSDLVNSNITQSLYDRLVDKIQLTLIRCPYCNQVGFTVHGYYSRRLKRNYLANHETDNFLVIMRVVCSECGKTHAILPNFIVPYSQLSLSDTIAIIVTESSNEESDLLDDRFWIHLEDIRNTKRKFKQFWKQRLLSYDISMNSETLTELCVSSFHLQFMQVHCQSIFLFPSTT